MKYFVFLMALLILANVVSCTRKEGVDASPDRTIEETHLINESEMASLSEIEFQEIILSFDMTDEEILNYWRKIDLLVDTESPIVFLGTIDTARIDMLRAERSLENAFFPSDIEFFYNRSRRRWSRSPVRPDGYVNFNNFEYRNIEGFWFNFTQYAEMGINPLKTFPGFIVTERAIPVYEQVWVGEFPNFEFVGMEEIGLLEAGTVIRLAGIPYDGYMFIMQVSRFRGYINSRDIDILEYLNRDVSYRIIDDRLYRFIGDHRIEIKFHTMHNLENGHRWIRNRYDNRRLGGFFFWERLGDYVFDENGDFIELKEYEPGK